MHGDSPTEGGDETALRDRARRRQFALMARLGPERARYLEGLEASIHPGYRFPWRIAECPGVAPRALVDLDLAAMRRILAAFDDPAAFARARAEAPERYRRPVGAAATPRFVATDFQRVFDPTTGRITRAVPEAQSFPGNMLLKPTKLAAFRGLLPDVDESAFFLDRRFRTFDDYRGHLRRIASPGGRDGAADGTIVLEVRPLRQSTVVDMILWCRLLGAPLVDVLDLAPDPATGELLYRRAVECDGGVPRLVEYDRPRVARNVLSRCIPPELDQLIEERAEGFDEARVRAIFQTSLARGAASFVVHPEDFFLVCKHTLIGNPGLAPALRPFTPALMDELDGAGVPLESGVIKPAYFAGGQGVRGVSSALPRAEILREAERLERLRREAPNALERLRNTWLWQARYGSDPFDRGDVPGFVPPTADDAGPVYQEIRFMWSSETPAEGGPPVWTPLVGMTRWSRVGDPANASRQKTAFTGTQGYLVEPD